MQQGQNMQAVMASLAAPFDPAEVRFRAGAVSGKRALALAYVDARTVQDRLDQVLGVAGWQDEYEVLDGGAVLCRLRVFLNGRWLVKSDVGVPGPHLEGGDRFKAAAS